MGGGGRHVIVRHSQERVCVYVMGWRSCGFVRVRWGIGYGGGEEVDVRGGVETGKETQVLPRGVMSLTCLRLAYCRCCGSTTRATRCWERRAASAATQTAPICGAWRAVRGGCANLGHNPLVTSAGARPRACWQRAHGTALTACPRTMVRCCSG